MCTGGTNPSESAAKIHYAEPVAARAIAATAKGGGSRQTALKQKDRRRSTGGIPETNTNLKILEIKKN